MPVKLACEETRFTCGRSLASPGTARNRSPTHRRGRIASPNPRSVGFWRFLEAQIEADLPTHVTPYLVFLRQCADCVDEQGAGLVGGSILRLLVHPPVHCSWMTKVEQWFDPYEKAAILSRFLE